MKSDCEKIKDQIADFVTGILPEVEVQILEQHLNECATCWDYARALKDEDMLLTEFFAKIDADMIHRQERVLQTINHSFVSKQTKTPSIWRTIMKSPITKIAAAAVIVIVISVFSWFSMRQESSNSKEIFGGFSLLTKACAAEDAIFAGENIVHIKNEIIVYPALKAESLSRQLDLADFEEQKKEDFNDLNIPPDFTWLPMCSLQANGQFRFNQLKLPLEIEPYTVIDQAWYEPATGCFSRVLQPEEKTIFANSYDGEFIYTSRIAPDGTLQLIKEAVTEEFKPPQKPAEFLGLSAGLRSSLREDTSMVQDVEEGKLQDGCPAHIYKVGIPQPNGQLRAYWLFKVRADDKTIAEKEFVIFGQTQLLVRRVLTELVQEPQISWGLAEVEGLDVAIETKPQVSVTPDMVIPNITVQDMVEHASFETYIFATNPSWTDAPQIIDCIDPASFGKRMFIFACRADDGRHLVLVQSPTYNKTLSKFARSGQLVYTSPNGFKVWGGGPDKWYSQILLQSAVAWIKDPPSADRIGYVLESPAGTFPALAVNGPISDEELQSLIDGLIPAKEHLKD